MTGLELSTEEREAVLIAVGELQKLIRACDRVYQVEFNLPVAATPPVLREAIREMIDVMLASSAPGLLQARRLARVS